MDPKLADISSGTGSDPTTGGELPEDENELPPEALDDIELVLTLREWLEDCGTF